MSSVFSLGSYISRAKQANTHVAKQLVLADFLRDVFGVQLEDLIPGIEKKVGSRIFGVKGRIDLLYSDIVFEVKVDLDRELENAKEELKKYFQALIEMNPQGRFIGIVTDLIKFKAFIPIVEKSLVKGVKEISAINVLEASPNEVILWLDSYIFSKPKIKPTAGDLKFRFGSASPTYAIAVETLKTLWSSVKDVEDVKLRFDLWQKNMEIVYGSAPSENAFIEQTYLVTLVKLVTYYWLSGDDKVLRDRLLSVLRGEYFVKYGINNLIEEDFFSWILHREVVDEALQLFAGVAEELLKYDLTQIDEDFFKEIYENIVERGQRHRIGEYYTPEWLAELTLREVLELWWSKSDEPPRIIDPACGSGTFLVNAIRIMKERLKSRGWRPEDILSYMLTSIVGVDINPLAVTIAKANYLFALGELLSYRKGSITIPVYVADSIKLPEVKRTLYGGGEPVYEYEVGGFHLQVPVNVAKDRTKFGKVLAAFREAIDAYRNSGKKDEVLKLFERTLQGVVTPAEFAILKNTLNSILALIDNKKDSIWVYMLSNIYIPVALTESKFDIVVGNPPWVIMRYVENKEYQGFVKKLFLSYELLRSDQVHLFTTIEIATAFFCRISDLYLKDNGIIGFVMPRSILTGALQHAEFRKFRKPPMTLHEILDLEKVAPLFNIPACVLIASKGGKTEYPVPARRFSGKLPEKNLKLSQAMQYLKVEEYSYQPPQALLESPYYDLFKAGASIYPRTFFFIDFIVHPTLGIDIEKPYCRSSIDPEILRNAKEPWKRVIMEGNVEKEFIYATVLSGDLMPFRCEFKPVVLPVKPTPSSYKILDVEDLRREGYNYMASWLEKAQKLWEKLRTKKSEKQFPKVINRLDHQGLLSSQNPNKRYVVIYNTSGANLASCIVDRQNLPPFKINSFTIKPVNFVADETTMFYETNNELEAHYLCAILNSDVVNELIKPLQPKGSKGERHIVRRPFVLPIPNFDPNNPVHRRLADLSKACHEKASRITLTKRDVAARRKEVRDALKDEMAEINKLVSQLLGLS
ncbi:MAG: N-6 DNA methylase [Fervidicoccaceae archaeon]|nr:N-6 DNA methylase [Fervidicoccaceae archaeon]